MAHLQRCSACEGRLVLKKRPRPNKGVRILGFVLLALSLVVFFVGVAIYSVSGTAGNAVKEAFDESNLKQQLSNADLPKEIVQKVKNSQPLTEQEKQALTPQQREFVEKTIPGLSNAGQQGGAFLESVGKIIGAVLMIIAIGGCILAYFLVRGQKVLECVSCQQVIAG